VTRSEPITGFLLVDKPQGWTSHDVVAKVRRIVGQKKVGHAGTLDPMATGLLVLGLGRATRLLRFVQDAPKEYVATAVFGVATDSLDADGAVLDRAPMDVTRTEVQTTMERFVGVVAQVPPMVSARKVGGRRLYDLAREGVEVEREARKVTIHELEMTDFAPSDYPEVSFRVVCSKGTYVRTLADDVARALGGRAHLVALRRVANGSLRSEAATSLDILEKRAADGSLAAVVLDPAEGLGDMPGIVVDDDVVAAVANGVSFPVAVLGDVGDDGRVRMLDRRGRLRAVYRIEGKRARAEVVVS
jgi:tRNA pseudouridine55 synthase